MKKILGISGFYHDAAAALIVDGEIIAAAQEERFSRKKHDPRFPVASIEYCLKEGKLSLNELSAIVFYDKPFLTFERLFETYFDFAPRGILSFLDALPIWLKEKLLLRKTIRKKLKEGFALKKVDVPIYFSEHHASHAASCFYPSPFESAAVLCMDGVGEWATTSAWNGEGASLTPLWEIQFPHSLGLLYSAFTYFTGFKVNSGEYKVMGLAPYGEPKYVDAIYQHLIDVKSDGTFRLNPQFFDYCVGRKMTNRNFEKIFDGPARKPEGALTQREMDLARSVQVVTEEIVLKLANRIFEETGKENLCLAGGVALNCVSNGRLLREGPFKNIWIQPAAGDAGGAIGCALGLYHQYFKQDRKISSNHMKGAFLGPHFSNAEVKEFLEQKKIRSHYFPDTEIFKEVARELAKEKVVGWMQGKMEFGPRSLGGRSILGDPRSAKMQSVMNLKIKYRESFRPFAPAILREKVSQVFELNTESPYMLLVAPVKKELRKEIAEQDKNKWGIDLLNVPKSTLPAITHVDYSARVQTVTAEQNDRFYQLLKAFDEETGCPVLVNTSFNVRGEPIVCSPEDAYRCFMRTEMDVLVLENFLLYKEEQPHLPQDSDWKNEFALD